MRHSTKEVQPTVSEARHLRSSISHLKTKSAKFEMHSDGRNYTKPTFFKIWQVTFLRFWVREPNHSENLLAEMCYLYRKPRPLLFQRDRGVESAGSSHTDVRRIMPTPATIIGAVDIYLSYFEEYTNKRKTLYTENRVHIHSVLRLTANEKTTGKSIPP